MDADTKDKIDRLLRELRSWNDEWRYTLEELVEMFDLPPFVIQQIADSEGIDLVLAEIGEKGVDPDADTQPIKLRNG